MFFCKTEIFPIGKIAVFAEDNYVTSISITDEDFDSANETVNEAIHQLHEYFLGERRTFDLKIKYINGTDFQKKVWDTLRKIPYGETATYSEIASITGHDRAARAVGNAVHNNPFLIVNPCHRVVAAGAGLGGFAYGTKMKKELLDLEEKFK